MAKFYRFNNAVEHVHKPEDVQLDYFMHFWTAESLIQKHLEKFPEIPWLDTFIYCWVFKSITNWNNNA